MSASISSYRGGFFGRLLGVFKPKDPFVKSIEESIVLLDRMIRSIESSKKGLEFTLEEHKRKMRVTGGQDKALQEIIDEENKNIAGYLNLFTKVYYDLMRVRLRLETITQVQEPMKVLPEVLDELKRIEPDVEKINPQLLSLMRMIEQKVGSIQLATDSSTLPQAVLSKYMVRGEQVPQRVSSSIVEEVGSKTPEKIPLPPVESGRLENKSQSTVSVEAGLKHAEDSGTASRIEVPVHVVEQWILAELREKAGILDIQYFTAKYRVPRDRVYEALRRLEEKGLVKLKRF
ncbi:MAG: hypothetical protein OWQ48_01335 [Desulfurococcus sp.]|nr:hypothetical protein [Desulfurococcus sp.]